MRRLSIDLETYSEVDLLTCGVYPYVESRSFQILLLAYAWDEEPVQVVDLARGEKLPREIREALLSDSVQKCAFNAAFERACLTRYLGQPMLPYQWQCTAVWARMCGLPGHLEGVCEALGLGDLMAKDKAGKGLIRTFCRPNQVKGLPGKYERCTPKEHPDEWEAFKAYCKQDVRAERAVRQALDEYRIPKGEQYLWELDQKINERGIGVDEQMIETILSYYPDYQKRMVQRMQQLTNLPNPNSQKQLMGWLSEKGIGITSLRAKEVDQLIGETTGAIREVLKLRRAMSKTSIRKYEAMKRALCQDGRIRGTLQFYGAGRSGRWAGRLVQLHNLPQNKLEPLEVARDLVKQGEFELLEQLFGEMAEALSQLVRTALIPKAGCRFIICDFSAIEARVLAWLADERWRIRVFEGDGKIYEASASQMFGIPLEHIHKGSPWRQKGKVAELACGYGGGVGALKAMGAGEMGLSEEELVGIISSWRKANPQIVRLWKNCEGQAREALDTGWPVEMTKGMMMREEGGTLWVTLPSGRQLAYCEAIWEDGRFCYSGIHPQTKKWSRLSTYGGKWVENIVQAIARDCLALAMIRLEERGYPIVMHVHDEVVLEVMPEKGLEEALAIMGEPISWAPGLVLKAEGYEALFYQKD